MDSPSLKVLEHVFSNYLGSHGRGNSEVSWVGFHKHQSPSQPQASQHLWTEHLPGFDFTFVTRVGIYFGAWKDGWVARNMKNLQ